MSQLKLKDIKFDRRNYRVHSQKNKDLIKRSIEEAGLGRSIVIDAENEIIGGNLYCTVSIWDAEKQQWISKQDVGVESYTEKEKGQSSDSFKRACFNIGIGRELYTAPFIWIGADKFKLTQKNNKYTTYDKFIVKSIDIQDGVITDLAIVNERTGVTAYKMRASGQKLAENEPKAKVNEIICLNCKKPIQGTIGKNGVSYSPREIYDMTKGLCTDCYKQFKARVIGEYTI